MKLLAGELNVEFEKVGDRFPHKLLMRQDDVWSVVLESIEGTDEDKWPASPPLQQIVAEPIGKEGRMVLLGVGLSGTGHWSISVDENEAGELLMDIACRVSGDHGFLGSKWRLGENWIVSQYENPPTRKGLVVCPKDGGRSIEISSVYGDLDYELHNTANPTEISRSQVDSHIIARPSGLDLFPKPQRWAVRFKLLV